MSTTILSETERSIIFDNMVELLTEYDYTYTDDALFTIIDTWAEQKQDLLFAFKKHPNYIKNEFCIAFNQDFERVISADQSYAFRNWLIYDALHFIDVPHEVVRHRESTETIPWNMYYVLNILPQFACRTISAETAQVFGEAFPTLHFHAGEKTSRAVNRICEYLGYTKLPAYNREFAKYADSLSPLVIKRHTVLSINPLDYLTMSFGNSWASCHTIDKHNKRDMPSSYHGQYSSGTISYMLDGVSMVLYTTEATNEAKDYWKQPKVNRQMFHWGEEKLIQGRLYPQDNDGNGDAYTPYRSIVQNIISEIFDFPNLWKTSKGKESASQYVVSKGTHYHDYEYYNNCTLSRVAGSENEADITIGHLPICIECGYPHYNEESINCCREDCLSCAACGCDVDEEDAEFIDGAYYCHDCCDYCECCHEYHRSDDTYVNNYGWVCEDCLSNGDFIQCEDCEEWFCTDDVIYLENLDIDVCENCLRDNFTQCDECGNWRRDEDISHVDGEDLCPDCFKKHNEENEEE